MVKSKLLEEQNLEPMELLQKRATRNLNLVQTLVFVQISMTVAMQLSNVLLLQQLQEIGLNRKHF
jgi:hypothetical protein